MSPGFRLQAVWLSRKQRQVDKIDILEIFKIDFQKQELILKKHTFEILRVPCNFQDLFYFILSFFLVWFLIKSIKLSIKRTRKIHQVPSNQSMLKSKRIQWRKFKHVTCLHKVPGSGIRVELVQLLLASADNTGQMDQWTDSIE